MVCQKYLDVSSAMGSLALWNFPKNQFNEIKNVDGNFLCDTAVLIINYL